MITEAIRLSRSAATTFDTTAQIISPLYPLSDHAEVKNLEVIVPSCSLWKYYIISHRYIGIGNA